MKPVIVEESQRPGEKYSFPPGGKPGTKKTISQFEKIKLEQLKSELLTKIEEINGIHFLAVKIELMQRIPRTSHFEIISSVKNLFLVLASETDGKANLNGYDL